MSTPTLMLVWPRGVMPTLEDVLRHGGGQWVSLACNARIRLEINEYGCVFWGHAQGGRMIPRLRGHTRLGLIEPERDNRILTVAPFPGQVKLQRLWTLHEIGTSPCDVELEYRDGELYYTPVGLDDWHPLKPAWGRGMALTHA